MGYKIFQILKFRNYIKVLPLWKRLISFPICIQSSRVGVIIIAMGPSSSSNSGWALIWRNSGSKKARVLPDPVLAIPIISRPDMITGMAWAWIGVGFSKLAFKISNILDVTPHCCHALTGRGQVFPKIENIRIGFWLQDLSNRVWGLIIFHGFHNSHDVIASRLFKNIFVFFSQFFRVFSKYHWMTLFSLIVSRTHTNLY